MKLSEQIKEAQDKIQGIRARQTELKTLVEDGEHEVTEDETVELDSLREDLAASEKRLVVLQGLERDFAEREERRAPASGSPAPAGSPAFTHGFKDNSKPGDLIVKMGLVKAIAHLTRRNENEVIEERY